MVKELWYRSLIKTGTWRIIAFAVLCVISYVVTGSIALATSIALVDWLVKTILYFIHERMWTRISFGRQTFTCKKGGIIWFTGLSGSGKTTLADAVAKKLNERMINTKRLDGDVARRTFSNDLGFSAEDRAENCRRAAHVGSYLAEDNIVLASFISPAESIRAHARKMGALIIHVECPISECARRDPKGMYGKLEDGKFMGQPFTGMHPSAPYENVLGPDLKINTHGLSIEDSAETVISFLEANEHI